MLFRSVLFRYPPRLSLLLFASLLSGTPQVAPARADNLAEIPPELAAPSTLELEQSENAEPQLAAPTLLAAAAPMSPSIPTAPSSIPREPLVRAGTFARAVSEFDAWVKKAGGALGAMIIDADTGTDLGSVAEDVPVNPASNQKVVTAAAALRYFGAGFRFKAGLYGRVEAKSIPELVLRSNGDPSLEARDLEQMVQRLKAYGVERVQHIRVDQGAFDNRYVPPGFEQQPNEWAAFRAPVSAVALNRNATVLHVAPGAPGDAARVWFEPQGYVDINGSVRTERAGKTQTVRLTMRPQKSDLLAVVGGSIGPQSPEFRWSRRIDDPSLYAGHVLRHTLTQAGIRVDGAVTLGGEHEHNELASRESKPLGMLLAELGKHSDNFYAEMLFKAIGARFRHGPGTSNAGAAAIIEFLSEISALESGTQIGNGSGLFNANKLSPRTLARVLSAAHRDPTIRTAFIEQLAIGGIDGTLRNRFTKYRKQQNIRAKTGTLNSVVSLSGYVFTQDQQRAIAFSLLVTELPGRHGEIRRHMDDLVTKIAKRLAQ